MNLHNVKTACLLVTASLGNLLAQTQIDLRTQAKRVDFSNASSTKPSKTGTTLPATCSAGETFLKTDATPGANFYACTAANVWTVQGNTLPAYGPGSYGKVLANDDSGMQWESLGGDVSGSPDGLTVNKLQGRPIGSATPSPGHVLAWDGTQWTPQAGATIDGVQANKPWLCNSTNGTTSYTCSLSSASALTAYAPGMWLTLLVDTTNNGTATLNVDGLGVKNIRQSDGVTNPVAGQIAAGRAVTITYDGTAWRLPPYSGVPFSATANQFVTAIDATGVATKAQPSFSNLAGNVSSSQMPALTGDVTTNAGSVTTSLALVNAAPGQCGDSTHFCQVTTNAKGLVTQQTAVAAPSGGIGSLNGLSGTTQTFVNDTNITLSSAGTTHTLAWNGLLGLDRGGMNANLSATGGPHQVLKQTSTNAPITVGQLGASDISGLAASATTDATNASNITAGTLPNSRLSAVPNSALANSSVTVSPGSGLSGGGAAALGGSVTLNSSVAVNSQAGPSYTVTAADGGKFVTFNNASAIAVTLPQATGSFGAGWYTRVRNLGAGVVTITPTTSTIDGAANLVLQTGQGVMIASDGTNYQTWKGFTWQQSSAGSHQFANGITAAGAVTYAQPSAADVSGLAASATTDATNASNITAGTLPNSRLSAVPNSALANSSVTVSPGNGLSGGGAAALGGSVTLNSSVAVNSHAGTSYTVTAADGGKFVTFNNASAIAVTLPQATGSFGAGWYTRVRNLGAGVVTITPTTSTIDGAANLVLQTGQGVMIASDGTNYQTWKGFTWQQSSAGSHQFANGITAAGAVSYAQPSAADVSGLAASATTDATNASNIGSGTLGAGRLPQFSGGDVTTSGAGSANLTIGAGRVTNAMLAGSIATSKLSNVQGSNPTLLTASTISGVGAVLCTDANGGATTSGCPSGGGGGAAYTIVPHSATPTFTVGSNIVTSWAITLGENSTATVAGAAAGNILNFKVCQPASGGPYTFTWPTGFTSASTISPIASACTKQTFVWDGGGAVALAPATVDSGPSIPTEAAAPSGNPAAGFQYSWSDSTAHMPQAKDNSGNLNSMVRTALAGTSHQWVDYIANTGIPHTSQPAASDISGLAASATTDATNASNIGSGTLGAGRLPQFSGGDVTTSGAGSANLTIGAGRVTNAMLAGSIATSKLANVQGNNTNLLTASTIGGVGVTLCTDANGGATTSGCSSGGGGGASYTAVTYSATPTFTVGSGTVTSWSMTLTGNVTSSTLSGAAAGSILNFKLCQNATGGYTFAWPAGFGNASTISPISLACTKQTFVWDGGGAVALAPATVDSGPSIPTEAAAPSGNPAVGFQYFWSDSTAHMPQSRDNSGNLNSMVRTASAGTGHQWVDYIASTGIPHTSRPSCADLSDAGAGCSGAGGGTTVNINGSNVSNPNFNATTPAAQANNVSVTFQASSSNVSAEVPVNSANAVAGLDANARIALAQLPQDFTCVAASGSSTDYTCSFPAPPTSLVAGERYRFKADVANTAVSGKPTVAFNSFSAAKIVKVQGGVTTELAANDIRANQWVDLVYDGTNFQMLSQLGNAASGGSMVYPDAGVPKSTGGAWAPSYTVGVGANNLPQLDSNGRLAESTSPHSLTCTNSAAGDTAAFAAAMGAAGVYELPKNGTCLLNGPASAWATSNITLDLNGGTLKRNAVDGNADRFMLYWSGVSNVKVRNGKIDLNGFLQTTNPLSPVYVLNSDVVFEDVTFLNSSTDQPTMTGIFLEGTSGVLERVHVLSTVTGNHIVSYSNPANKKLQILDVTSDGSKHNGIVLWNGTAGSMAEVRGATITNVTAVDAGGQCSTNTGECGNGILVYLQSGQTTITKNHVRSVTFTGVRVNQSEGVAIEGNEIDQAHEWAIYPGECPGTNLGSCATDTIAGGNRAIGNRITNSAHGINDTNIPGRIGYTTQTSQPTIIADNVLDNIRGIGIHVENAQVTGNVISNTPQCISVGTGAVGYGNLVDANTCTKVGVPVLVSKDLTNTPNNQIGMTLVQTAAVARPVVPMVNNAYLTVTGATNNAGTLQLTTSSAATANAVYLLTSFYGMTAANGKLCTAAASATTFNCTGLSTPAGTFAANPAANVPAMAFLVYSSGTTLAYSMPAVVVDKDATNASNIGSGTLATARMAAATLVQPCEVHIWGTGTSGVLQDTDDETNSCKNQTGATLTIQGVACWADAGSPTVTPVLTAGGTILTGAITCSQAEGGAAGTLSGTPTQADGKTININITSAGGTAKTVIIYVKRTL